MNQVDFERRATAILEALFEQIEDQLGDWLEVDLEGGILTLELPDGGTYVVNKHAPNREIWVSSPVSGAWHFASESGEDWQSTRAAASGAAAFPALLADELGRAAGRAVRLDL